jgi:hypothetical protein
MRVVGGSGWDKVEALSCNRASLTIHDSFPFTADEDEHLIHIRVDLLADLTSRWDTHQLDLAMVTSENLLTKVRVFLRKSNDILVERHGVHTPFSFSSEHANKRSMITGARGS